MQGKEIEFTYDLIPQEKKEKIEKRMSKDFIEEYITYIKERDKYNTEHHINEDFIQKVYEYAIHNNTNIKDVEKLNKRKMSKTNQQDNLDGQQKTINLISKKEVLETEKSDHQLVFAFNRYNDNHPYTNEDIAFSALLSLVERQPKYYNNNYMSQITTFPSSMFGVKLNNNDAKTKYNVRKFFMPIRDEKIANNYKNLDKAGNIFRISRFDLDGAMNLDETGNTLSSILNDASGKLITFTIEKDGFIKEIQKILCITPKLIVLSVKNHLRGIENITEEEIERQTQNILNYFFIRIKTLSMLEHIINDKDIDEYSKFFKDKKLTKYFEKTKRGLQEIKEKYTNELKNIFQNTNLNNCISKSIKTFEAFFNKDKSQQINKIISKRQQKKEQQNVITNKNKEHFNDNKENIEPNKKPKKKNKSNNKKIIKHKIDNKHNNKENKKGKAKKPAKRVQQWQNNLHHTPDSGRVLNVSNPYGSYKPQHKNILNGEPYHCHFPKGGKKMFY